MQRLVPVVFLSGLAVVAGISFVLQAAVNARLRSALGSPNWSAFASYAGGTLAMAIVLALARDPWPGRSAIAGAPVWSWLGGAFGAVYVVLIIVLLPRLGTAAVLALFVAGQMLASLSVDAGGLFGVPRHPIDAPRVVGALLIASGVFLVRR